MKIKKKNFYEENQYQNLNIFHQWLFYWLSCSHQIRNLTSCLLIEPLVIKTSGYLIHQYFGCDDESSKQNSPIILLTQYNVRQNFKPTVLYEITETELLAR